MACVQQHGHHGGVDAAGKGADHVLVADLFGHFLDVTRSTKLDMLQSGTMLQTLNRKLRSMASPSTLWCTSGWNCTA